MTATKTRAKRIDSPERIAQRKATADANATLTIDFGSGKTASDFGRASRRGQWARKLEALVAGVKAGSGNYDEFYCLGESPNVSWASSTISNLNKVGLFAEEVALEAFRETKPNGTQVSQVWGCVVGANGDGLSHMDADD